MDRRNSFQQVLDAAGALELDSSPSPPAQPSLPTFHDHAPAPTGSASVPNAFVTHPAGDVLPLSTAYATSAQSLLDADGGLEGFNSIYTAPSRPVRWLINVDDGNRIINTIYTTPLPNGVQDGHIEAVPHAALELEQQLETKEDTTAPGVGVDVPSPSIDYDTTALYEGSPNIPSEPGPQQASNETTSAPAADASEEVIDSIFGGCTNNACMTHAHGNKTGFVSTITPAQLRERTALNQLRMEASMANIVAHRNNTSIRAYIDPPGANDTAASNTSNDPGYPANVTDDTEPDSAPGPSRLIYTNYLSAPAPQPQQSNYAIWP